MIHYHGGPIVPQSVGARVYSGRHAMVSYAHPDDIGLIAEFCQSFAVDNGAFSFWRAGKSTDWDGYYEFVSDWARHPAFDWALIPDVIDGSERDNDNLIYYWPHGQSAGVPVWHLHETLSRLEGLVSNWPRSHWEVRASSRSLGRRAGGIAWPKQ